MSFLAFLILLIIGLVVAVVLHFALKVYIQPGLLSFISKVIIGWVGARIGTPIFGEWFGGVAVDGVYIIPAILGSLALIVLLVDLVQTIKK